jgi:hypothetical protein
MTEPIQRRPSWLRFSLRTLLVVMTVLCVWLGIKVNAARRQKEVVDAILKAGGTIYFDYQKVPRPGNPRSWDVDLDAKPPAPAWLHAIIGDEYFRDVVWVALQKNVIKEADWARLGGLHSLAVIYLTDMEIEPLDSGDRRRLRDADLAVFARSDKLHSLNISGADINGTGLASLEKLGCLTSLTLAKTPVSEQGVSQIGRLASLTALHFANSNISQEEIRQLQKSLPNCKISNP